MNRPLLLFALLTLAGLCTWPAAATGACPGGGGPGRRPPPAAPGTPSTPDGGPSTPTTPGPTVGPNGRGGGPPRTSESIDSRTWEYWWSLNQSEYMPVLGYEERDAAAEGYAPGRRVAHEKALELLLAALEDGDDKIRTAAARCLAVAMPAYRKLDQQKALLEALKDPYREVREVAGLALGRRKVLDAAPTLRKVLQRTTEHRVTRAFAAIALTDLGDEKGIEIARKISRDADDPDLAGAILIGFGNTQDKAHTPHLLAALRTRGGSATRRRRVRCDAMMALGKLGDPEAIPALVKCICDRERLIQRAAALALGGFPGNEEAARALVRRGLTSKDMLTRGFAAISLARNGFEKALARVQEVASEDRDVVQGFALLALGLYGRREAGRQLLEPLRKKQHYGHFGAAALAAGLLGARETSSILAGVVDKIKDPRPQAYACVGLGLLKADQQRKRLRRQLWINSSSIQFGVPVALAMIEGAATAKWLDAKLLETKRDTARGPLIDALSTMAGSDELQTLVSMYSEGPRLNSNLRRRLLYSFARVLTDHEPSYWNRLCRHTYFPFNNEVLAHIFIFP